MVQEELSREEVEEAEENEKVIIKNHAADKDREAIQRKEAFQDAFY